MPGDGALTDPFAVLGLPKDASCEDVRKAYHELALKAHPDKDHSVPAAVATARFQRIRAAYELLSDPARKRAVETTVVSAPFKPAERKAAAKKSARPRSAPCAAEEKPQDRKPQGRPAKGPKLVRPAPACPAVLVLDSEDEKEEQARREEEWEAAEKVRREHARRRMRRAEEQARRLRAKGCEPFEQPAAPAATAPRGAYVRLSLRKPRTAPDGKAPSTAALKKAFADAGARVVRRDGSSALLAVDGESQALGCALAFHGWDERPCDEAAKAVFSWVSMVVAPVSGDGRAIAGPNPTVAATCKRVVACDAEGGKVV